MKLYTPFVLAGWVLHSVSAHYFFPHLIVNGNFTGYNEYVRENDEGFMPTKNGYENPDFRCRTNAQSYAGTTGVYKVKAGDEIGFGLNFGGKILHPGPMQAYISRAPGDVRQYDGSGDWFKIWELGPQHFSNEGIRWGSWDKGNFTFTLPKETPSGQYLVRIEHIGVHGAGEFGGAEFYYNCAQIEVGSDSTAQPGPLVKIPGLYAGHEDGIVFYMYRPWIVNYTMPGPPVWPQPLAANVTASGVSIAPTVEPWTLPAVTSTLSSSSFSSVAVADEVVSSSPVRTSTLLLSSFSSIAVTDEAASTSPVSSSTSLTMSDSEKSNAHVTRVPSSKCTGLGERRTVTTTFTVTRGPQS